MTELPQPCLIVPSRLPRDSHVARLLADTHALGLARVAHLISSSTHALISLPIDELIIAWS